MEKSNNHCKEMADEIDWYDDPEFDYQEKNVTRDRPPEYIFGHINVYQGWGTRYALFFTTERIIVAKTGNYLNLLWGGLLVDGYLTMCDAKQKGCMHPEQLLANNKKNYCIWHEDIKRISIRKATSFRTGKINIFS